MSNLKVFTEQELMDLDMGTVKGKVRRTLEAGTYLFRHDVAGIVHTENRETGAPRMDVGFRSVAVAAVSLDDPTKNPEDYVGQNVFEKFYGPTPEDVGYCKTYFDNVLGAECKQKFSAMMELLNTPGNVYFKARVTNTEYNGRKQANLSRDPLHFVGLERLTEEEMAICTAYEG